jgi:hypothetical protein
MNRETTPAMLWSGRVISGLVVIVLLADSYLNLLALETMRATFEESQIPLSAAPILGIITLVCAILYAIPRTAMLGAILTTGFFGGAILTHLRLGDLGSPPQLISLAVGIFAWAGLWLRDARVRALLPLSS